MPQRDNLLDVVGLLLRRRRLIAAITAGAAIICIIISLLLPEYYRASTTFLAASPDQSNPSVLNSAQAQVEIYGTGDDIERIIGVANSEETISFLIDSFDLFGVYDIDRESRRARYQVREAFADNYEVLRTRYDEVQISVEDTDPERAAAIANAARDRVEFVLRQVIQRGLGMQASNYESSLEAKRQRRLQLVDSLQALSTRYGIVDVTTQSEQLSGMLDKIDRDVLMDSTRLASLTRSRVGGRLRDSLAVIQARLEAQRMSRRSVKDQLERFARGRSDVEALQIESELLAEQLAYNLEILRRLTSFTGGTVIYLVDKAAVPDAKVRPVRWLIVVGGTLVAFVLAVLGVLVHDTYKSVEWRRYLRE